MFDSDCDSGGAAGQENGGREERTVYTCTAQLRNGGTVPRVAEIAPDGFDPQRLVSKLGSRAAPVFYAAWRHIYRCCSPPNRSNEITPAQVAGFGSTGRRLGVSLSRES
jgi:hypothetical protein